MEKTLFDRNEPLRATDSSSSVDVKYSIALLRRNVIMRTKYGM